MDTNTSCWNCKSLVGNNQFFCHKCKKIQKPNHENEFKIFGVQEKFDLNLEELEEKYLKLQKLFHPDKYSTFSEQEIKLSTSHSSLINDAYQKLCDNNARAELLLKVKGYGVLLENRSFNDSDILEQIMDIQNECLEATNLESKKKVLKNLNSVILVSLNDLKSSFAEKKYEEANKINIKLSYLEKMKKNLRNIS
ncbi:MAG: Fe-S protein assembly co-chaperone HscB [Pelagibacteraceae bacterium TMED65]|nr:Fe-S protein assembly co-chaperone HscB [Rickettsiales bacterium]OUU51625.1 MAG: Fe-S protein assembly co-chaperone HscB [Pelagibacteraceae bacterium TMED65]|tara:strand:+ start:163 stop:747 length:585 start_codon:yes stop_codon:yes gene_type:complete